MTLLSRRKLIAGLGALIAAPAIVRATSIMPVRSLPPMLEDAIPINLRLADLQQIINEMMIRRMRCIDGYYRFGVPPIVENACLFRSPMTQGVDGESVRAQYLG